MDDSEKRLEGTGKEDTEGEKEEEHHQRNQKCKGKRRVEGHQAKHERTHGKRSPRSRKPMEKTTSQGGGPARRPLRV